MNLIKQMYFIDEQPGKYCYLCFIPMYYCKSENNLKRKQVKYRNASTQYTDVKEKKSIHNQEEPSTSCGLTKNAVMRNNAENTEESSTPNRHKDEIKVQSTSISHIDNIHPTECKCEAGNGSILIQIKSKIWKMFHRNRTGCKRCTCGTANMSSRGSAILHSTKNTSYKELS